MATANGESPSLQAIKYADGTLQLLDQRLLPFNTVYLDVPDTKVAWQHIRDMVVRGAPAIGVTGALSLAVELRQGGNGKQFSTVEEAASKIGELLDFLVTSRPTAVNLADSAEKLKAVANQAAATEGETPEGLVAKVVATAEAMLVDDVRDNKAIGHHGAEAVVAALKNRGKEVTQGLSVLTHCNTGSLATAHYGTALGVIRTLHERGLLQHVYCTETRPYNQGARLTAFELVHDGLPATLICDSAAASLMASGKVDAVVVGADRVVANGDTANKIGTYKHAITAAHHSVPFFVAAPTSTLDPKLASGDLIDIEERPHEEITHHKGERVVVEGINVWNPSFDITPACLIEAVITEKGTVPKKANGFEVAAFMARHKDGGTGQDEEGVDEDKQDMEGGHCADEMEAVGTSDFYALDVMSIRKYVRDHDNLCSMVGPAESMDSWHVREVGDGNVNFVYIVQGPSGSLCIKQALPFVRCVGESWPLTQDRVRLEVMTLRAEHHVCPAHVPAVHLYDPHMALIAMEYLAPPFIILRQGIIAGHIYPQLSQHLAYFLAHTLFHHSLIKVGSATLKREAHLFNNPEMCRLTEQVIFTEPYCLASNNRWSSPQLDQDVEDLRHDTAAKVAVSRLKMKFIQNTETLLHGDMHTGSVMVTPEQTKVIDPEFAFYGPMCFDMGKMIGELLLAYFASWGRDGEGVEQQRRWLLECTQELWNRFSQIFLGLWDQEGLQGDLYPSCMVGPEASAGPTTLKACQQQYMTQLFLDSLGMAGACMIRRIVGIAHVADMDTISDVDRRVHCERMALRFGRHLLVEGPQVYHSIEQVVDAAGLAARTAH